jgi:hypothetical protein
VILESSGDATFVIRFNGGLADNAELSLDDYAVSLGGWRTFIGLAMRIALDSDETTASLSVDRVIRIRVIVERRGSWETLISFGREILPNAAWDLLKLAGGYASLSLIKWCMKLAKRHAEIKATTLDVDQIAEALEQMISEDGLTLSPKRTPEITPELFPRESADATELEEYELKPDVPHRRAVVDAIDRALKDAVKPIGRSCTSIEITSESTNETYLNFGIEEKQSINGPLEVSPTKRDWESALIKFVRINKKTGRALFYFADDPRGEDNFHYSLIIDSAIHSAGNIFTEAFSKDAVLKVFLKHGPSESGSIRTVWQITANAPETGLFSMDGSPG